MKRLVLAVTLCVAAYSQQKESVKPGEPVKVPALDHPFVSALQAHYKWEAMSRDGQPVKLTTEPAPYELRIAEDVSPVKRVTWDVSLVRTSDGKVLEKCQYWPVTEPLLDFELRDRIEVNQFCASQIAIRWEWNRKNLPPPGSSRGFSHERWHRQINFEIESFRQRARIWRNR